MNKINKVKIIKEEDINSMQFYDVNMYDPFLYNNELYFKLAEGAAINVVTKSLVSMSHKTIVQDCNLEIKIIK